MPTRLGWRIHLEIIYGIYDFLASQRSEIISVLEISQIWAKFAIPGHCPDFDNQLQPILLDNDWSILGRASSHMPSFLQAICPE